MANERESSDQMASLASKIMSEGTPLENEETVQRVIIGVRSAFSEEQARHWLAEYFGGFCDTAKSLAASVVSQADGPE